MFIVLSPHKLLMINCSSWEKKIAYQLLRNCVIHVFVFNSLRAKFFRGNINMYLHFMSFLHTNKTQVVEIPPRVRQGPAYST